ncbi:MAG: glycosyltransferase [Bradyrhizobium sp.]
MDELEFYRDEVRRLSARLDEIKSSWSYRFSAPVRLIERTAHSIRKRSLSNNLKRMKAAAERELFGGPPQEDQEWSYARWVSLFDTVSHSDEELIRRDIAGFEHRPKLTVVILPDGAGGLDVTVESLSRQIYREFEVIIADPAIGSAAPAARALADVPVRSAGVTTSSVAEIFNAGLAMASGEFLIAIEGGDSLSPHALYLAARAVLDERSAEMIYGDHDELTPKGERTNPFFKPGWSRELCLAFNYVGRAVFVKTTTLRRLGGARTVAGDAWQWDLVLRAADGPDETPRADGAVHHVPVVLLHQGSRSQDRRRREIAAGHAVVAEALARRNIDATLSADEHGWFSIKRRLPHTPPHVTIIIPTRDRCDLLRKCVDGILARTDYPSFDVMIIDNRSRESETFRYYATLQGDPRVRILPYPGEFNYAKLHNEMTPFARGEVLAFVNNDLDVIGRDWLEAMVGHVLEADVGAVGAKLYYPDDTIQHGGVVLGSRGAASHMYVGSRRSEFGPHGLLMVSQEVSAVTAACLVCRRSVFTAVGGLDEKLAVDFNDIDFCLRLRERGYRIVWAADAVLYHYESATRGNYDIAADTPERRAKLERFQRELGLFRDRWSKVIDNDPFYNLNLTLENGTRSLAFPSRAGRYWKRRLVEKGTIPG